MRQPGSSFKPFVYQVAINLGYSPMSEIADISRIFEGGAGNNEDWKPKNEGVNFRFNYLKRSFNKIKKFSYH